MKKTIFIALLYITKLVFASNRPDYIPDSLTNGLILNCWKVTNPKINTVKNPQLGELFATLKTEQAGVASWKANYNFVPSGPFFIQMEGYLAIANTRSYIFKLQGLDGSELYIDNKLVVSNDGIHEFKDKDAEMYLEKGLHKIKVVAFNLNVESNNYETSVAWNKSGDENFDWIDADQFYCSVNKTKNLKLNLSSGKDGVEKSDNELSEKSYSNATHPSYDLTSFELDGTKLAVGGLDFMSDGSLIVSTWDSLGQVFRIKNVAQNSVGKPEIKRIAVGLAEPLGVKVVNNKIYVLQKQELTELIDSDGDEIIDEYKTICNAWGATGNFHEFAFGLVYKDGYFYAALATAINPGGKSTIPQNKDRGKAIKIGLDGTYEVVASGLRTPNGIGIGVDNEIFIADNQGDWLPSCKILHLSKDAFFGSYSVELLKIGALSEKPPVVWLPQGEIGNSASQPAILNDGIYKGQMIHGDVTHGGLKRVFVEKIGGEYQGIVFPFMQGFQAGVNRICWGPDGALYVGGVGSNGNWSHTGKKWYGLEKIKYNQKTTFEILAVRAKANGMEIEFTEPLAINSGNKPTDFEFTQWKYIPTMQYGGPKNDPTILDVLSISYSKDRKKVFVELDGLKSGYVVYINLSKSLIGKTAGKIWANKGWYTLNKIPIEKGTVIGIRLKSAMAAKSNTATKPATKELSDKEILAVGPKLVDESGCLQCHAPNKMILGPSFKMINDKYNSDPATLTKLTEKVHKGGSGVWGEQAMGANTHLDKNEIKKMVRYILALP